VIGGHFNARKFSFLPNGRAFRKKTIKKTGITFFFGRGGEYVLFIIIFSPMIPIGYHKHNENLVSTEFTSHQGSWRHPVKRIFHKMAIALLLIEYTHTQASRVINNFDRN
jgi:hypothetical protein